RLSVQDAPRYVLKVAGPEEGLSLLEAQDAAMLHLAHRLKDLAVPVPRPSPLAARHPARGDRPRPRRSGPRALARRGRGKGVAGAGGLPPRRLRARLPLGRGPRA